MNVDTFLYRDVSTFASQGKMNVDILLYREESTLVKVLLGGEMVWYRNVLFDPS